MDRAFGRRAWAPVDFFELHDVDPLAASIERGCHCLLFGPKGSGKTTLLFQHALAFLKRDPDARVLFVCRRDAVEAAPPLLPRSTADLDAARRISMKYLSTDAELCKLVSVMHVLPVDELPNLIVIDDLSGFFTDDAGARGNRHEPHGVDVSERGQDVRDWEAARDRREREMRVVRCVAAASECANQIRTSALPDDSAEDGFSNVGGFRGDAANDARRRDDDSIAGYETRTGFTTSRDDRDAFADASDGCLLLASETSEPGADAPSLGFLLRKWFKCALRAREIIGEDHPSRDGAGVSGSREPREGSPGERANPHAGARKGTPYVLERAWVGSRGGFDSSGTDLERSGAVAYAVDAAGAALTDARFVDA